MGNRDGKTNLKGAMSKMHGFDRVARMDGSTYKDCSTVILVPEREPWFHKRWLESFQGLIAPMNAKRAVFFCIGDEVGQAYTNAIKNVLANPELAKWKYILTIESDNLCPPDAHIKLLESIEAGPFDAVGGLYFTKGEINQPMCYGSAADYAAKGVLEFQPLDVRAAIQKSQIVECNGLGMGCTLFRMELFRSSEPPWFKTLNEYEPGVGSKVMTQDLYAFERWKRMGRRFACDTRVKVGHMDFATGEVY